MNSTKTLTPRNTGDQRCAVCNYFSSSAVWYFLADYGYPICPDCYHHLLKELDIRFEDESSE
jgi:hypothetical protein